jgi:hypothetical protein
VGENTTSAFRGGCLALAAPACSLYSRALFDRILSRGAQAVNPSSGEAPEAHGVLEVAFADGETRQFQRPAAAP